MSCSMLFGSSCFSVFALWGSSLKSQKTWNSSAIKKSTYNLLQRMGCREIDIGKWLVREQWSWRVTKRGRGENLKLLISSLCICIVYKWLYPKERPASNILTCGILVAVSLALASLLPLAHRWHGPTAHVNLVTPGLS